MQTLNQFLNLSKDQVTTLAYHQKEELTYIHHLGGAFIPNSLIEKSQILIRNKEERIVLANFVST